MRALPEFVRLITVENIERGRNISGRRSMAALNAIALDTLAATCLDRGEREGVFRPGLKAWQVHLLITSLCFYAGFQPLHMAGHLRLDLWEKKTPACSGR